MPEITWSQTVEIIEPHVVRISTPQGSGTGFLISNGQNNSFCGIATAAHVLDHAHYWEEPIRIDHVFSGKSIVIRRQERAVFLDDSRDTAVILFNRGELPIPANPLPLAPKDKFLKVGNKIGWLGFPAIPAASLCFFSGDISAWLPNQKAYLVDGVAINGVRGGPAFHTINVGENGTVVIIGVMSAYVPNRATGEVLPGLSVVRDVSQFHELAPAFASIDQARKSEPPLDAPPLPKPDNEVQGVTQVKRTT
jgi:hypothetical protein